MRKNFLLIMCLMLFSTKCFAQAGEWTWMKGDKLANQLGFFGIQGIADSVNKPPNLAGPVAWKDKDGNLWLFGGYYYQTSAYSSALWKYDITLNDWIWIKGDSTFGHLPVYATMGIPSSSNDPGGRCFAINTWVDSAGNFWMFGGQAVGVPINDELWKYDPSTNEWTWMKGLHQPSFHGAKGVSSSANNPGDRSSTINWYDGGSSLWLFGGITNAGRYDDLWRYDILTNNWVWMWGDSTFNHPIVYGTKGVEDSLNNPGARYASGCWTDDQGHFWLFAGSTHLGAQDVLNDVWRYNSSTGNWIWVGGFNYADAPAISGAKCESDTTFIPLSRIVSTSFWKDPCGNLWVFGGTHSITVEYNDFWLYSTSSNKWTWVSGSLSAEGIGVYGTQGIPDQANVPGARYYDVSWVDNKGNLWLFGGNNGYSYHNDLWKYTIDTLCPAILSCYNHLAPQGSISALDSFICEKFCTNFTDQSTNNPTAWQWLFPGGDPSSSTLQNPNNICYNSPGVYDVTLITTNAFGDDTLTSHNYITVYPTPPFPTITQVGYTLTASPASSYQWQLNGINIPGATNQSYNVLQTGLYTVVVGDLNGCVNSESKYVLIVGIDEVDDAGIFIYPNPSSGSFTIELPNQEISGEVSIDVMNTLGQKVFSSSEKISSSGWKKEIDLSNISRGVYFIEIKTANVFVRKKIVIAD